MATQGPGGVGLIALKGMNQKPKWITTKDLHTSHWMFKSTSFCNLSRLKSSYSGYLPQGGPNWMKCTWWRRGYTGNTSYPVSLNRQWETEWYLASPYGPVGATNSGAAPAYDAVIGPDYNVPSEDYLSKLAAAVPYKTYAESATANDGLYTRVVGAKHRFYFTNYLRFPVRVRFVYDPYPSSGDGYSPSKLMDRMSWMAVQDDGTVGTVSPGSQKRNYEGVSAIKGSCEDIIIPPTLDNGDMGRTVFHDIKFSPKDYTPEHFAMGPVDGTTSLEGLWRIVDTTRFTGTTDPQDGWTAAGSKRLSPWKNHSPDHGSGSTYRMKTAVHMYMKIELPQGRVYGTQEVTPTAGELGNYRSVDVSVKSEFINEVMAIGVSKPLYNGVMDNPEDTNAVA